MAHPIAGDMLAAALVLLALSVVAVIAFTTVLDGYRVLRDLTDHAEHYGLPDASDDEEGPYGLAA